MKHAYAVSHPSLRQKWHEGMCALHMQVQFVPMLLLGYSSLKKR